MVALSFVLAALLHADMNSWVSQGLAVERNQRMAENLISHFRRNLILIARFRVVCENQVFSCLAIDVCSFPCDGLNFQSKQLFCVGEAAETPDLCVLMTGAS